MKLPKIDILIGGNLFDAYSKETDFEVISNKQLFLQANKGGQTCSQEEIRECAKAVKPIYKTCVQEQGKLFCAWSVFRNGFSTLEKCKPCIEFGKEGIATFIKELETDSPKEK
jgi:hypothetical protein